MKKIPDNLIPPSYEFIYVGDPMCTWCWGISREFLNFRKKYFHHVKFSLIMGGIRAGENSVNLDKLKDSLKSNWINVAKISGQIFNLDFFNRKDYIYDSEPSCRAVLTFEEFLPEKVFEYKEILERAFYTGNEDITNENILSDQAAAFGIDKPEFLKLFHSSEMKEKTQSQFDLSDTLDVRGLPTILISCEGKKPEFFTKGFVTTEEMEEMFLDHIRGNLKPENFSPGGQSCDLSNPTC